MSDPTHCRFCERPLTGAMVGCGDGQAAHTYCYELQEPERRATEVRDIFSSAMNPVLGRNLVAELPLNVQLDLIDRFNREYAAGRKRALATMKQYYEEEFGPLPNTADDHSS